MRLALWFLGGVGAGVLLLWAFVQWVSRGLDRITGTYEEFTPDDDYARSPWEQESH